MSSALLKLRGGEEYFSPIIEYFQEDFHVKINKI